MPLTPSTISTLRRRLLAWYDANRRRLPWRTSPADPYATLVSEAMLQQTQVCTVVPYFTTFMERFPTVAGLAESGIDEVLPYWAGLGYYRRCHNLHAAARRVMDAFGGRFPRDVQSLRSLPGVGRYTAGAIASIAFGVKAAAVDGNVKRVLGRLKAGELPSAAPAATEAVWQMADRLVAPDRPGDFNQAVMELGATLCVPRRPLCEACPIRRCCDFAKGRCSGANTTGDARRPSPRMTLVSVALRKEGRVFYRQRAPRGLWSGLWEWPARSPLETETLDQSARSIVADHTGLSDPPVSYLGSLEHRLTHRRITFHGYEADAAGACEGRDGGRWMPLGTESELPLSVAQVKLIRLLSGK